MSINYKMVRFLIIILFLIPIIIKIKRKIKKSKENNTKIELNTKQKILVVLFIIIIYLIAYNLLSYPFENFLFNFKSSEEIFNYYNPSEKVNKKIEGKKYAYFISRQSGNQVMSCHYYIKTKGWHVDINNKYGKVYKYDNTFSFDPTAPSFIITELYDEKKIYIYARFKSGNNGDDISDSQNSKIIDINHTGIDWYGKLIILDSNKMDYSTYYISIGDKNYQLLNNNKIIKKKNYN